MGSVGGANSVRELAVQTAGQSGRHRLAIMPGVFHLTWAGACYVFVLDGPTPVNMGMRVPETLGAAVTVRLWEGPAVGMPLFEGAGLDGGWRWPAIWTDCSEPPTYEFRSRWRALVLASTHTLNELEVTLLMRKMRRELILILLFVFIDVLGFSLILPLLPFYADTFGASPTLVGLLMGANALAQLVGAPIIGRLSDRYGRRPLLLVSIAGTLLSFVLLGLANSLALLFLSRILDGFLGGNISLAQAYITDVTDEKERASGLGLIGAGFGLGFMIGPALGGWLSGGLNFSLPAFVAAGMAALNLLGVFIWLPESLSPERREQARRSPRAAFSGKALFEALGRRCVGPLLIVRLFYGLAFTMFTTVFSLYADKRLGLDAQATGYVLTYVGLLVVAVQGGGIRLLTKRYRDNQLVFAGAILLTAALLAWAFTPSLWLLLVVLAPLALAGGLLNIATNSSLTKSVYPEEVGGTLGLAASWDSLTRVVSPIAGGFLLDRISPAAPGLVGVLLVVWLIPFIWQRILFVPDMSCPPPRGAK